MVKKSVIVSNNQSVTDIALQLFGSVDGVANLMRNNEIDFDTDLYAGQKLYYEEDVIDARVMKEFNRMNYGPAIATGMSEAPLPTPDTMFFSGINDNGGPYDAQLIDLGL